MSARKSLSMWALAVAGATGCGGETASGAECWPIEGTTPGGTVELGTGRDYFEPIPSSIQFIVGNQGGTFLALHARMTGLAPGNLSDPTDPSNPKTLFTVELADGHRVGTGCPTSVAYGASGEGTFTLARPFLMPFLPLSLGVNAFETDIKVSVEIIDSLGHTARSERTVRALTPAELGGITFDAPQAPPDTAPPWDAPAAIDASALDADPSVDGP